MKIGILTFHRTPNYGAQLQAYALRKYIESLGHEVHIIDYWPNYRNERAKFISFEEMKQMSLRAKILYLYNKVFTCLRFYKRIHSTEEFASKYLEITDVNDVDIAVYGSDQIWRKFNRPNFKEYDPVYFGQGFVNAKKRISYAASMGHVFFKNPNDKSFFLKGMRNFDAISVRETDLQKFLEDEAGVQTEKVCDPTLLLSAQDWQEIVNEDYIPSYKYILYYRLQSLQESDKFVKRLSEEKDLKVLEVRGTIPPFHYSRRYRFTANAQEFLSLLYGAQYVVSSSFHGVALSVRLNKQFYFISNEKAANRAMSLLSDLGLQDRRVTNTITHDTGGLISYSSVERKLNEMIDKSKKWLGQQLKL